MRYHLIPRDLESAETRRRYVERRARRLALARLASDERKERRASRRFWLTVGALYALSFAYVVYFTWG